MINGRDLVISRIGKLLRPRSGLMGYGMTYFDATTLKQKKEKDYRGVSRLFVIGSLTRDTSSGLLKHFFRSFAGLNQIGCLGQR
jgi:hypothetical protein